MALVLLLGLEDRTVIAVSYRLSLEYSDSNLLVFINNIWGPESLAFIYLSRLNIKARSIAVG